MEPKAGIQQLWEALRERDADIRAEVLLCQSMQNGVAAHSFVVKNNRFFETEFSRDTCQAEIIEDEWNRHFLEVQLSRPGLYDMLPESLFFQPDNREFHRKSGAADMAAQYRQQKAKEKELRRFFQPFENEFFYQQLQLEKQESALLDALNNAALNRFLAKFWNLPSALPAHTIASFMLLIPHAHRINGNVALMQDCLRLLLREEVTVKRQPSGYTRVNDDLEQGMGGLQLGDNMICGNSFMEDYPVLHYKIGPLKYTNVSGYLEGGAQLLLINTFNQYFTPAEADIDIEVAIEKESGNMCFTEQDAPVLGYSSVL